MRPPRAICPAGNTLGRVLGPAGEPDRQRRVLAAALRQFETLQVPGSIIEFQP